MKETSARTWTYIPRRYAITRRFWNLLMSRYPALAGMQDSSLRYRQIMGHILFYPLLEQDEGSRVLVLSRHIMAALLGVAEGNVGLKERIEEFGRDVLPLHPSEYCYSESLATVVRPEFAPEILAARDAEPRYDPVSTADEWVWLDCGWIVQPTGYYNEVESFKIRLRRSQQVDAAGNHPARDLFLHLNQQSQVPLHRVLSETRASVQRECSLLPDGASEKRDAVQRLMRSLDLQPPMLYHPTANSPRLQANYPHVNYYPREFRKLALGVGNPALPEAVSLDLKCCGLAIAAKIWGDHRTQVPTDAWKQNQLQKYMQSTPDIWTELLGWVGLSMAEKDQIKTAVHSLLYGKYDVNLREHLAFGSNVMQIDEELKRNLGKQTSAAECAVKQRIQSLQETRQIEVDAAIERVGSGDYSDGIGEERANLFLQHQFIKRLFNCRRHYIEFIEGAGGIEDAFGNWRELADQKPTSLLSYEVQSWELRMMLAMLPILKAEKGISVLSWLHDGVTLYIPMSKQPLVLPFIQQNVDAQASAFGFATRLDQEKS